VMPARYFSRTMHHPGFTVEYYMVDTNAHDAKHPSADPDHNICSSAHNPRWANCRAGGGPSSIHECEHWFWRSWVAQKAWLRNKLSASTADWQVVVTHFPCDSDMHMWRELHVKYGLDLLVTGHRHDQELWAHSHKHGGLTCVVTGGGGGITSEGSPHGRSSSQYGFFDFTFSKERITVELVAISGAVIRHTTITPRGHGGSSNSAASSSSSASCAAYGCGGYDGSQACQCNSQCRKHHSCCADFEDHCGTR